MITDLGIKNKKMSHKKYYKSGAKYLDLPILETKLYFFFFSNCYTISEVINVSQFYFSVNLIHQTAHV